MGLLDDLDPAKQARVYSCKVRTLKATLDEADQVALQNAVDDERWLVTSLMKALAERGLRLNKEAIVAHRKRVCSCYRT
jgi:membrane-bound inhibitor of C-type lysozyme